MSNMISTPEILFLLTKSNAVKFVRSSTLSWMLPVMLAGLATEGGI